MVRYRLVEMERTLEPELMDDEQQSIAYAEADFSTSNQFFVDSLVRDFPTHLRDVVDIGCGPADVVIRLARAAPNATITALDGSAPMIALGRAAARAAGVDDRLVLLHTRIPGPPPAPARVRCGPVEGPAPSPAGSSDPVERGETRRTARRCRLRDGSGETGFRGSRAGDGQGRRRQRGSRSCSATSTTHCSRHSRWKKSVNSFATRSST